MKYCGIRGCQENNKAGNNKNGDFEILKMWINYVVEGSQSSEHL